MASPRDRWSLATLEWVATAYVLTVVSLMPAGGRLADVYGRKRLFLIGVATFTAASLPAALVMPADRAGMAGGILSVTREAR
jgi:MFS family permease